MLLNKHSIYNTKRGSIYDLEKIPGASTQTPERGSKPLPPHLSESRTKLSLLEYDTEPSSPRSEDDYLPSTLRAVISSANKSEDIAKKGDTIDDKPITSSTSASNLKTTNSQKKKSRTIRRSKSEKSKDPRVRNDSKDNITKSLHTRDLETSIHEEKYASATSLERISRSEELKKPPSRDSEKNRRRSENLHQRQSSFRREKGRQRKGNSSRDLASSKPSSNRRPKSTRNITKESSASCKNLDTAQDETLLTKGASVSCKNIVVDWSRETPLSEEKKEKSRQKLKKSSSNGSNARRTKRFSKSSRNLLQDPVVPEGCKDNANWKRSPPQENRKRQSKQKQVGKKSEPQKSAESPPTRPKKPKSRRAMMMSSKATTESCRDLLRKIHEINNDRLNNELQLPNTLKEESQTSSIEMLSRSMTSITQNKPKKEFGSSKSLQIPKEESLTTSNSIKEESQTPSIELLSRSMSSLKEEKPKNDVSRSSSLKIPKEDPVTASNRSNNSGKSRRKVQDEEKPLKPPRTKSAPLMLKGKSFNGKISRSRSGNVQARKGEGILQSKPKKKSLSSRLISILSDGKGAVQSKDDETICTGNRNKDRKERKRFMRRTKSDSSLRESSQKMGSSGYDLMLSMHSIASQGKIEKDDTHENIQGDVESDDEDSFAESNPVKPEKLSSTSTRDTSEKNLSEHMKISSMVSEHCDDIISIAEIAPQKVVKVKEVPISKPKRPSCLQIDFSQLSEHGTTGNVVVRSKKLERRVGAKNNKPRSNRIIRA